MEKRLTESLDSKGGFAGDKGNTINSTFNAELERQINKTLPNGHIYKLGNAGDILQSAGLPDLPIELNAARLYRKSRQANHPFDLSDMKNLPDAVQDPIAVFDSTTQQGSFVILTALRQEDKNYIVALQADKDNNGCAINDIRSVYPKKNRLAIIGWINNGFLRYADKKRMADWLSKPRSNSEEVGKSADHTINIIKDFENIKKNKNLSVPTPIAPPTPPKP